MVARKAYSNFDAFQNGQRMVASRAIIRVPHNAVTKSHWTGRFGEALLYEESLNLWNSKMGALPTEKKIVRSEGLHRVALERHYSVPEIAGLWGISEKTVRRLFEGEDGVLRWGSSETTRKRGYQNLRIPESVLIRVHYRRERA